MNVNIAIFERNVAYRLIRKTGLLPFIRAFEILFLLCCVSGAAFAAAERLLHIHSVTYALSAILLLQINNNQEECAFDSSPCSLFAGLELCMCAIKLLKCSVFGVAAQRYARKSFDKLPNGALVMLASDAKTSCFAESRTKRTENKPTK